MSSLKWASSCTSNPSHLEPATAILGTVSKICNKFLLPSSVIFFARSSTLWVELQKMMLWRMDKMRTTFWRTDHNVLLMKRSEIIKLSPSRRNLSKWSRDWSGEYRKVTHHKRNLSRQTQLVNQVRPFVGHHVIPFSYIGILSGSLP